MKQKKITPSQEAALNIILGYFRCEITELLLLHGHSCFVRLAAQEVLEMAGVTEHTFLVEFVEGALHGE